ncbi:hypothetical protein IWX49DRAFT_561898 [Phyllosticta citricarpa]
METEETMPDEKVRQVTAEEKWYKDEPGFFSHLGLPLMKGASRPDGVNKQYSRMGSFLDKKVFSDMTVSDSTGRKYHVHKVILSSASILLANMIERLSGPKGSKQVNLEMENHRPEVVEQGLFCIYNQHYNVPLDLRTFHEQPRPKEEGEDLRHQILFNTEVYAFASSNVIPQVRDFAFKKIVFDLPQEAIYHPQDLPGLLMRMCKIMPEEKKGSESIPIAISDLHSALCTVCSAKIEVFLKDEEFRKRYPRVFLDGVQQLAGSRVMGLNSLHLDDNGEPYSSHNPEETAYANQVEVLLNNKDLRTKNPDTFYNCIKTVARLRCHCTSCRYRHWGDDRVLNRATEEKRINDQIQRRKRSEFQQ